VEELVPAELMIEAVVEDVAEGGRYRRADEQLRPRRSRLEHVPISITRLAAATKRPDRVIGMHFMNPVPVMRLVEVIRGLATSEETAPRSKPSPASR
jgi:3-hydroxybutyryl-CoA dehydrogenase